MTENLDRAVLVTGGTGSVGESIVAGFAGAGYRVSFLYHQSESRAHEIAEAFGATPIQADLSRPIELVDNDVDILINNAAINETSELTGGLAVRDWDRSIALNLTAPFLLIQQCLPHMVRSNWGRIVNISSIYGLRAVETNLPYTVSKHGLSGLTKTVAREYGAYGITCNEICPGPLKSRLLDRICAKGAAETGVSIGDYVRDVEAEIPTGKLVLPSAVAQMALVLASADCESVNGSSIVIDGGMIA